MASIFKRKGATRFHIEFLDVRGQSRRVLGFKDRQTSKELAAKIERTVAIRQGGGVLAGEMLQWLESLRPELRDKLAEWGVIDPQRAAAGKLLAEHVENWGRHTAAKGRTPGYVKENTAKIKRLAKECGWKFLSDIDSAAFIKWRSAAREDKDSSIQTVNHYLRALRTFCNWLVENRFLSESPIRFVHAMNIRLDRRRERRALTKEEIGKLIAAAQAGKRHHSLTGRQRALIYRLAIESGLRYKEIWSLSRASFDLDGVPATVAIAPEDEKARRGDILPLRPGLAADLKTYLAFIPNDAKAFPMWKDKGGEMLQQDLKAAGIAVEDEAGRVVDFHALRTTFGSLLNLAGVPLKTAQDLMRHSDPKLTANFYTMTTTQDRAEALGKLPDFHCEPIENKEDTASGAG